MNPLSLVGTGKIIKTCFCVGWTDIRVLFQYYAPELMGHIRVDRKKFHFKETETFNKQTTLETTIADKLKEVLPTIPEDAMKVITQMLVAIPEQ